MGVLFKLRLVDADRERYGCKEWLTIDLDDVTAWEYALIQDGYTKDGKRVKFDSPQVWMRALTGQVVTDAQGEPVTDPVLENGEPVLDDEGRPKRVPRRSTNIFAEIFLVWLALRHNGTDVPMADAASYRAAGVQWEVAGNDKPEDEPVPGESEGKDDAGLLSESENAPTSRA
jgi:hypothetical protein